MVVKSILIGFGLRASSGNSGDGETAGTESERNAAAGPQTEAHRIFGKVKAACDGRAACEAERSKPRAGHGGQPPKTTWRWVVEISRQSERVAASVRDSIAARYRACGRTGEIFSCGKVRFEVVRLA